MKKIFLLMISAGVLSCVAERKGQTDPSVPPSYIGSRARGQALQTDKFPRPPEQVVSETTQQTEEIKR